MHIDMIDDRKDLIKKAVFAGGCFWCVSAAFYNLTGVEKVVSGYIGGSVPYPSYRQVCTGTTGHYEAVLIEYNPLRISYLKLLEIFFAQIDPTDDQGQFADRGPQYKTAVFSADTEQRKAALNYIEVLEDLCIYDMKIVTKVMEMMPFYPAEEYHQDYAQKNKYDYEAYAKASGRKAYITSIWSRISSIDEYIRKQKYDKPAQTVLKKILTPLQFAVTQGKGTEKPFDNPYYYLKDQGIYVDIASMEPLFSSTDKYESGSGWPSFKKPLEPENIIYKEDKTLPDVRIEVRSRYADSHLGHVFPDGPADTGLRYCMNSASLKFIPANELTQAGYPQYKYLFL